MKPALPPVNARYPAATQPRVPAFADLATLPEVERQHELTHRALAYVVHHPGYVPVVLARNTQRMLNLEGSRWWRAQGSSISLPRWSADAGAYGFFVFAVLAVLGAMTATARQAPRWLWLVPLVLFATVIAAGSEIRYRAPVEPFLVLLAALALRAARRLSGAELRCDPAGRSPAARGRARRPRQPRPADPS